MKGKKMTHYCLVKTCDWKETSHKLSDGIKCPKCEGPVNSFYVGVDFSTGKDFTVFNSQI